MTLSVSGRTMFKEITKASITPIKRLLLNVIKPHCWKQI